MATTTVPASNPSYLDESAISDLAASMRGALLRPQDDGYEDARTVRNGLINRHPGLIARCSGVADVVAVVTFAREHDLLLSIRGGGHNVAGNAVNDGGLVIDLSPMRGVWVDPAARTVRVQGGATWADVDRETQLHGMATPGGKVSTTGVGGLTLHGGFGWLRRTYGYSIDNLIAVEIVTADGEVRTASETEHRDLFWAVRGAGSNFGVVTGFTFRLHPVGPQVAFAAPFYALEDAERVLPAWRDFMANAPDEVSSNALFWSIPAVEGFPTELQGRPIVILAAMHAGDVDEGERVLKPLRTLATPLLDLSGPMPYVALQSAFDPFFPKGWHYYWKSCYLDRLDDDVMATILHHAANRPSPESLIALWHLGGGAASRIAPGDTAFGSRDMPYMMSFDTTWTDPAENERCIAWTRAAWEAMRPFGTGSLYQANSSRPAPTRSCARTSI